jgi:hypothetical protein
MHSAIKDAKLIEEFSKGIRLADSSEKYVEISNINECYFEYPIKDLI